MYSQQMQRFEDGGLKDEGGMVDEVSGNDVPVGSTRKEVRDDVPAMLSEGEFVFPADVVRFIGLEELMRMRQEAKMGLKQMEAMGQMGNSEEATMPDDMPFNEADLIILAGEPEMGKREMNRGGVIHAQQGAFVPNTPEQQQQSGIAGFQQSIYADRPINPYQYTPPASAFTPADAATQGQGPSGYRPQFVEEGVGRKVPIDPKVTSQDFVQEVFRDVQYINPTTGDIIDVRFLGDTPIAGIPDGYIPLSEYTGGTGGTGGGGAGTGTDGAGVTATQVIASDDDGGPDMPTPEPFDWDNADPDAVINEIGKINGGAGGLITAAGFLIGGPAFGLIANTMVKANEKQTLEKLTAKLDDPEFVAKMRKAGKLEELKTQLEALKEKTEKGGTLGVGILGMITDTIKKIGGAMGATEEEQKKALKGTIEAETGEGGSTDGKDVTDKGTNVLTVSQLKGEFSRGEKTAKGAEIPDDYKDRMAAGVAGLTYDEYMYQKESGTGIFAADSAIDSVTAASDEDAPTVAKAKADLAANSLKTRGVTAENISEAEFSKIKDSPDALAMLGIDPRTTNYQELQREQQQNVSATQTTVDEVTGETVEGDGTGTDTTLVREETGEALGTTTVDVQTMTTDELSEVMMGLETPQLMSLSQLTMAGISAKSALEYFVNGDAQALAKEIANKQQTNIVAELDNDTSTAIQTALTTTRIRTAAGDDTPTATDIQKYLDQVAGETSTSTTTPTVSRPSVSTASSSGTDAISTKMDTDYSYTPPEKDDGPSTPVVTGTDPISTKMDKDYGVTTTSTSTSTSTPTITTGSSGMPSLDAYVSSITSSNNNDDDPPSFAGTSGSSSSGSSGSGSSGSGSSGSSSSWSSSDETNVGSAVGSSSGGSGSLVTGKASEPEKWSPPGFNWNQGGLVGKPVKKKRATKKKRGVAARKK